MRRNVFRCKVGKCIMDAHSNTCTGHAMTQRLFVYGTLAPGRANAHILGGIDGSWEAASVRGTLHPEGWGAAAGFPGIVLDDAGPVVDGFLFSSDQLAEHWPRLDDFEGEGYERVPATVMRADGTQVQAFLYALSGR